MSRNFLHEKKIYWDRKKQIFNIENLTIYPEIVLGKYYFETWKIPASSAAATLLKLQQLFKLKQSFSFKTEINHFFTGWSGVYILIIIIAIIIYKYTSVAALLHQEWKIRWIYKVYYYFLTLLLIIYWWNWKKKEKVKQEVSIPLLIEEWVAIYVFFYMNTFGL